MSDDALNSGNLWARLSLTLNGFDYRECLSVLIQSPASSDDFSE